METNTKTTTEIKAEPEKADYIFKGIAYACIAFFCFTIMQAFNKLLVEQHNAVEIGFYRNLLAVIPCTIYVLATKQYGLLKTKMPGTLAMRVGIGTIGLILTLAATQALPLADATVIFFTSALLIPVLAHFFLKEHIGPHRWAAVFIGMSGVLLVAQPSGQVTLYGVILALSAATVHAIIQILIRAMRSENPFTITYYFFLIGTIFPALFLPWVGHMPSAETLPFLIGVGITGGMGQYFLTRGFQMAPASLLGPFNYTGLIWATGLDIVLWHYIPGWPVFVGGAIIIASNFYIIYRERKKKAQKLT
jgi:drug/metabolite transporter (DMT)-like permease